MRTNLYYVPCTIYTVRAQICVRMQNLDVRGQLGHPSCPKLSLANSEIQVESQIMESILVFGGEILLETWIQVLWKNFAVYTPPNGSKMRVWNDVGRPDAGPCQKLQFDKCD
jgi:hypothetical protein